jgi:hypothetical protein
VDEPILSRPVGGGALKPKPCRGLWRTRVLVMFSRRIFTHTPAVRARWAGGKQWLTHRGRCLSNPLRPFQLRGAHGRAASADASMRVRAQDFESDMQFDEECQPLTSKLSAYGSGL